jgi:hypothetical protein
VRVPKEERKQKRHILRNNAPNFQNLLKNANLCNYEFQQTPRRKNV